MKSQPVTPTVTQDVALHCHDEQGRPFAFIATFGYLADDPYAVWLTFHIPGGDVSWVLARSLLVRGLSEPSGEGDVRLWPSIDDDGRAVVCLDFHSPEGRLLTEARTADLQAFLARTWVVVPLGAEGRQLDLDRLVQSLLSS